jgi:hypothetical protein
MVICCGCETNKSSFQSEPTSSQVIPLSARDSNKKPLRWDTFLCTGWLILLRPGHPSVMPYAWTVFQRRRVPTLHMGRKHAAAISVLSFMRTGLNLYSQHFYWYIPGLMRSDALEKTIDYGYRVVCYVMVKGVGPTPFTITFRKTFVLPSSGKQEHIFWVCKQTYIQNIFLRSDSN